jgi:hypothetical protein
LVAGLVMAVASVAGVLAHQLVPAAPRRGRAERAAARMQRRTATKLARVRRAAVRAAVAQIDDTGTARLVFDAGHYRLTRPRFGLGRRARLAPVAVPGLPVTPVLDETWTELDRELAAMLATMDPYPDSIHTLRVNEPPHGETTSGDAGGGLAMLDPGHDRADESEGSASIDPTATSDRVRKPRPRSTPRSTQESTSGSTQGSGRRSTRSIEELRTALRTAIETDPESVDPASAESIRRALRCSPSRARELRDSWKADQ